LYAALEKQGITLTIDDAAKNRLSVLGFTPAYGARPLGGVIRNELRRPLARKIVEGTLKNGSRVTLTCNPKEELVWKTE
jgi:ATP-dependent Clp protease ATP-binding subunit ClpA